jgi:hypothetical protein
MIAVARAIADRRDTLALGALLRGPLVGLTEEEIADAIIALPPISCKGNASGFGMSHSRAHVTCSCCRARVSVFKTTGSAS